MKFISDFLAVLLFFVAYFLGSSAPDRAYALASTVLGPIVRDGAIPPDLAPILLASAVAMVTITLQIAYLLIRRHKIGVVQWTSFVVFLAFGGATIYFHNDAFIKWKPTVLYWLFGTVLMCSNTFFGRNLVRSVLEPSGMRLPERIWQRLNLSWIAFFSILGLLNLYVAFHLSRDIWVSFKSIGLLLLTVIFAVLQSLLLMRHMSEPIEGGPPSTG
jgi:intracellular septation protein